MLDNILFGFELALPPEMMHNWSEYTEFVPADKDSVLITFDDKDFTVKE